jgi:hypothetical protein
MYFFYLGTPSGVSITDTYGKNLYDVGAGGITE